MRTRIKICGVTDPGIARLAVAAGADAIGLIFHPPSARHLELEQAAAVCRAVAPFVTPVAVLVNPDAREVEEIMRRVNPGLLQFHGEEPPALCAAFGAPYVKALRVAPGVDWREMVRRAAARYHSARGILLDTHAGDRYGGTGAAFEWGTARYDGAMPLILAGGLTPDNVPEALERVAPYGVDVSTGVETGGRKDPEKIRRFCRKVQDAM